MRVQRRPVRDGVAGSAVPASVPTAAMSEADDMPDEYLVRAETVPIGGIALADG